MDPKPRCFRKGCQEVSFFPSPPHSPSPSPVPAPIPGSQHLYFSQLLTFLFSSTDHVLGHFLLQWGVGLLAGVVVDNWDFNLEHKVIVGVHSWLRGPCCLTASSRPPATYTRFQELLRGTGKGTREWRTGNSSATDLLCGLGRVALPICDSIILSVIWRQ